MKWGMISEFLLIVLPGHLVIIAGQVFCGSDDGGVSVHACQ